MPEYADELGQRDQKSLLCAACAEGDHDECELFEMREYPQCACAECNRKAEEKSERAEERYCKRYFGGDGIRSYGPSDPKGW